MSDESLQLLKRWVDDQDQAAAADLFARYSARLIALAQKRLSPQIARRVDPEEIANSAARTFLLRVRDGRLVFPLGSDLWHLLSVIAVKKVLGQVEYQSAEKRSVDLETPLGDSINLPPDRMLADDPDPGAVLSLEEERERILASYPPHQAEAVRLKLQGYDTVEIAELVQLSESMVNRIIRRFAEDLRASIQGPGSRDD